MAMAMSIELLSLPSVTAALGASHAAAVADAITFGRMHVPKDWVSSYPVEE
jgi:hypothetical protein